MRILCQLTQHPKPRPEDFRARAIQGTVRSSLEGVSNGNRMTKITGAWSDFIIQIKVYFPGHLVVKNMPCRAGDAGSAPGRRTKTPYAEQQLSPHTTTGEPTCPGVPQLEGPSTTIRAWRSQIYLLKVYKLPL